MAKGVNKVILIGNLGADPEVRYMPSGSAVATINIATSESWKDKQTGERQERTEWHRVLLFNRLAEITGEYLRKGAKVYIEGSLRTRKWQDTKTGQDRYSTEVIANDLQMLDGRGAQGVADTDATNNASTYSKTNKNNVANNQNNNAENTSSNHYPEHAPSANHADNSF